MVKKPDETEKPVATDRDRIMDAALALAARGRWSRVAMGDIAAEAGVGLAAALAAFRSRGAVLAAFARRIDAEVIAGISAEDSALGARDRLFDILMRRFDLLRPHKQAVCALLGQGARDPVSALRGARALGRSMAVMLEAAGLGSGGLRGVARTKGLAVIYLATLRVWLADDSDDMAKTMAALDSALKRTDALLSGPLCRFLRRKPRHRDADGAETVPTAA